MNPFLLVRNRKFGTTSPTAAAPMLAWAALSIATTLYDEDADFSSVDEFTGAGIADAAVYVKDYFESRFGKENPARVWMAQQL